MEEHLETEEEIEETLGHRETQNMWTGVAITAVVAFVTVAGGFGGAAYMVKTKKQPKKMERVDRGLLVGTETVQRADNSLTVSGQGSVIAARELIVAPEVSGRITSIHDQLVPGGLIPKGERVLRINAQDTTISVAEQQTALEQARANLELEKGQQVVAQKEWELFKGDAKGQDSALALRGPQLKTAKVAVDAAEARLSRARLNLSRTSIRAPFDSVVVSENAEIGQLVSPNTQIARLVGLDAFWVQVSIPTDNLPLIQLPDRAQNGGANAVIEQRIGAKTLTRTGQVIRVLPNLDPAGRQARLLVEIKDPFGFESEDVGKLFLDAYVRVTIEGKKVAPTIEVARKLIHDGDTVYVFKDGTLDIRKVSIVWRDTSTVLIDGGLEPGEEIVSTRIVAPVSGMKLRKANANPQKEKGDKEKPADAKTGAVADETAKLAEGAR